MRKKTNMSLKRNTLLIMNVKEYMWLSNVKYLQMWLKTSYMFPKTTGLPTRGTPAHLTVKDHLCTILGWWMDGTKF